MPAYRDSRDDRWRYRKWILTPLGKKIRITGTPAVDTKVAAEAAERAHIDRVLHPERFAATTAKAVSEQKETLTTITKYSTEFLDGYLPDSKPSELKSKRQILDGHILPALGHLRLDEIRQSHVDAFVGVELKRGVCRKTINNRLAVLSTLLKYAHENKLILKSELRLNLKRKGAAKDAPIVAVPAPDVRKLVEAASDARYRVAVLLAAEAGLRIGEILGLQWTDIKNGELKVRRAVDSGGNVGLPKHDKMREVPLSPTLVSELARMPRRGLWIVSRLDGDMLSYWAAIDALRDQYERAGVTIQVSETGERRPWHSLRHTFGTECAARGVPITTLQELMGHEDIATTRRYVSVSKEHKHDAIALAFGGGTERQRAGNESTKAT